MGGPEQKLEKATERIKTEYQIDVIDHPSVMLWMKDIAVKDPEGFVSLTRDNTEQMRKLFGKEVWTNDGSKGWSSGWAVYENNLQWSILTGRGGTIFRLRSHIPVSEYLNDPRVGVGVVQYLGYLLKKLSE